MEDGQRVLLFQPHLPVPGPLQEQHGYRHAVNVLKFKGFMVSRIMSALGKEMSLLGKEKKLGCNIPCGISIWEMLQTLHSVHLYNSHDFKGSGY